MRDYQINLVEQLDHMTWRRFLVLVNNLSPYGAVAASIDEKREERKKNGGDLTDEESANRFFSAITAIQAPGN